MVSFSISLYTSVLFYFSLFFYYLVGMVERLELVLIFLQIYSWIDP